MASAKSTGSKSSKGGAGKQDKELPEVDENDALMASTLAAMDWAKKRSKQIGYAVVALAVAGGAFAGFSYYRANREEKATTLATKAALAEDAPLAADVAGSPEIAKRMQTFASDDERSKFVLASYSEARTKFADTGPGILARLGEAGALLDARRWDDAIAAYEEVRKTSLAAADGNVRMRCLEGIGYAREGKGMLDDARRTFEELANLTERGAKPLGLFHQARLDVQKADKPGAIAKLKQARDLLGAGKPAGTPGTFLKSQVERLLGELDPTAIPKPPPTAPGAGKGLSLTPEQRAELKKQGIEIPEGM